MKAPKITCLVAALAFSIAASQAVETDPVGFVSVTVPANSDAVLAVPLNRASEFKGVISAISGNTITVSGTPSWSVNQFVQALPTQNKTYAVQIASGTKEGMIGKVTANGTNTLTLQFEAGDSLTGVVFGASGDQIDLMPYWTPATLISSSVAEGTELYIFDNSSSGQNTSPTVLLQYYTGFGWFDTIGFTDQSDRPLLFGTGFIYRNNSTTSTATVSFVGSVPMNKSRITLKTLANGVNQDQTLGYMSPVQENLNAINLPAADNDELFLFNSSTSGKNKSPSSLLVYYSGRWYNSVTFADVTDTIILQPGNAMIFRKKSTGAPQLTVWQDLQSYLN